jgi:predicted DNA-binding transcriptional regulator AlpA
MITTPAPPAQPELLTKRQVCQLLQLKWRTLNRWINLGLFPRPIRFGYKTVRWPREVLDQYISEAADRSR